MLSSAQPSLRGAVDVQRMSRSYSTHAVLQAELIQGTSGILIVCAFLQIVWGTISRKLLRYMRLDIAELSQSLLEEERSRSRRSEENRTSVQNKYDEIRQNFRQKYGGENIRPSITRSDNDDGLLLSSF